MNGAPAIGDNGGPPINAAEFDTRIDPDEARLAHRLLQALCAVMGVAEGAPLNSSERASVREVWFRTLRNHLSISSIAAITGVSRKTVAGYCNRVEALAAENGFIRVYMDQAYDFAEVLPAMVSDAADMIHELTCERAIRRARTASAAVTVSASRHVGVSDAAKALARDVHAAMLAKLAAERAAQMARLADLGLTKRAVTDR